MAITTLFLTGFEAGLLDTSGSLSTGNTALAKAIVGGTIQSATPRSGNYYARIASSAQAGKISANLFPNGQKIVSRVAFKVVSLASGNKAYILTHLISGGLEFNLYVDGTDGKLKAQVAGGTVQISASAVNDGAWHVAEMMSDSSTTTLKLDWQVDGVSGLRATGAIAAAANQLEAQLGSNSVSWTGTVEYDDWISGAWTDAALDWYGDGYIEAIVPGSDGTHSFTANDFSTGDAGIQRAPTYTAFWSNLLTPFVVARNTLVNIAQRVVRTTGFVQIKPAAAPTGRPAANAVRTIMSYSSSGTQANSAALTVTSPTWGATAVWGASGAPADYSEATNFFKGLVLSNPQAGQVWDATRLNAITWQFGYSSDIAPVPTLQALLLEVDWPIPAGTTVTAVPAAATASAVAPTPEVRLSPSAAGATASAVAPTPVSGGATTVTAVPAAATASRVAPTPELRLLPAASAATAGATAPSPAVSVTVAAGAAAATAGAAAPIPVVTVNAVASAAAASSTAPVLSASSTVTAAVASATASAPVPVQEVRVPAPPAQAITARFLDGFGGSSLSNLWGTPVLDSGVSLTVTAGVAKIAVAAQAAPSHYGTINSARSFDLTAAIAAVKFSITSPESGLDAGMILYKDATNYLQWDVYGVNKTLEALKIVAGVATVLGVDTTVAWTDLRLREQNGTIYWEYSLDNGASWVVHTSELVANLFAVTSLTLSLFCGDELGTSSGLLAASFDSVSVIGPSPVPEIRMLPAAAVETASAVAPSLSSSVTVSAVAANATAGATAPTIISGATVTAVPATATASSVAATLSIGGSVQSVAAAASASSTAPSVSGSANVQSVAANATASAVAPTPELRLLPPASSATGSSTAPVPELRLSPAASAATASSVAPAVSGSTSPTISAPAAIATASSAAPVVSVSVTVQSVAAAAWAYGAPNWSANPSGETDLNGWGGSGASGLTRVNTFAYDGSWSMRATAAGGVDLVITPAQNTRPPAGSSGGPSTIGPSAGRTFTTSVWLYVDAGSPLIGATAKIKLNAGMAVSPFTTESGTDQTYTLVQGWQRLAASKTLVANNMDKVYPFVTIVAPPAGAQIWVDAVFVDEYPSARPYTANQDLLPKIAALPPAIAATASAPVPSLQLSTTVQAVAAAATAAMPVPAVGAGGTVSAPAAGATASSVAPVPALLLPSSAAAATASRTAPTLGVTVTAVPATATASSVAPILQLSNTVTTVPAQATAGAVAPTVTAGSVLQAVPATATASSVAPVVAVSLTVSTVPGLATASRSVPTPSLLILSSAGLATATAPAPGFGVAVVSTAGLATATRAIPVVVIVGPVSATIVSPAALAVASSTGGRIVKSHSFGLIPEPIPPRPGLELPIHWST